MYMIINNLTKAVIFIFITCFLACCADDSKIFTWHTVGEEAETKEVETKEVQAEEKVETKEGKAIVIGKRTGALHKYVAGLTKGVDEAFIREVDGKGVHPSSNGPEYWIVPGIRRITYICSIFYGYDTTSKENETHIGVITATLEANKTYQLLPQATDSDVCEARLLEL